MNIQKRCVFLSKIKKTYRKGGIYYLVRGVYNLTFKKYYDFVYCRLLICLKPPGAFIFQGRSYHYLYHHHNTTYMNERTVEIPIILEKIQSYNGDRILEIGNVLSNYVQFQHDIVDKYDRSNNVINQDVVDFKPAENWKYDLIVSISTMEHVGWDETPQDSMKIPLALENLTTRCLAPGGEIVITIPIGYNTYLDKLLNGDKIRFTEKYYLKRISDDNKWIEIESGDEIIEAKFGMPFPYANVIFIGVIKRDKDY